MNLARAFKIAVPAHVRETATEQERLLINSLANRAIAHGLNLKYEDLVRIIATRPPFPGVGVLEYRYFWKSGEWRKCFQNNRVDLLIKETGRSRPVVAPAVLKESDRLGRNLTFEECVAAVNAASRKGFKKVREGDFAGETFGVWVVDEKGAYKSNDPSESYALVDVTCRSCGFKKTFEAAKLRTGSVGKGGCPSCRCSPSKNIRNSSTAHDGAIARHRFQADKQDAQEMLANCVGWFTRWVGTAESIENYTDVMGNPEARAVWINIHGETL